MRAINYSTIIMTEKGYIYDGVEYEMDDLKRLTYAKNLNRPASYFLGKEEM